MLEWINIHSEEYLFKNLFQPTIIIQSLYLNLYFENVHGLLYLTIKIIFKTRKRQKIY